MTKAEIVRRLHEMVDERLFGNKPWPVDKESTSAVNATLLQLGLMEDVPGMDRTVRKTPLGSELHIDLMEAFMGFLEDFDLLEVLEMRDLIEKEDAQHLRRVLSRGAGWERIFKEYVRRAYSAYYNPTQAIN